MTLRLSHIHKRFGDLYVLKDLNMNLEEHKLVCILGPSGCGKTTLLNIISGVLVPDQGEITGLTGKTISYLFQEPRLLPWKTAVQNIDFVLKDKLSQAEREILIRNYIDIVGLRGFEDYYPNQLSGGMKQRVAIVRAFAYPSDILLMDEPFKGLDLQLKTAVMQAFLNLWLMEKRSAIFVTHDIDEAVLLGEEIYILSGPPTSVKGMVSNEVPHKQRNLSDDVMQSIEEQIYRLLNVHNLS